MSWFSRKARLSTIFWASCSYFVFVEFKCFWIVFFFFFWDNIDRSQGIRNERVGIQDLQHLQKGLTFVLIRLVAEVNSYVFYVIKKKKISPLLYDIKGFSNYQLTFLTIKAKWNNWTLGVRLDWAYFCWNWKYCNEIIFKCMNSTVGLMNSALWDSWTVHQCTVHGWLGQIVRLEPKKKKRTKRDFQNIDA